MKYPYFIYNDNALDLTLTVQVQAVPVYARNNTELKQLFFINKPIKIVLIKLTLTFKLII